MGPKSEGSPNTTGVLIEGVSQYNIFHFVQVLFSRIQSIPQ